jgi:hypothetical protein
MQERGNYRLFNVEVAWWADWSALGAGLYSIGIPKNSVMKYESALKSDKFLVPAHGMAQEAASARDIMQTTHPTEAAVHAAKEQRAGGSGGYPATGECSPSAPFHDVPLRNDAELTFGERYPHSIAIYGTRNSIQLSDPGICKQTIISPRLYSGGGISSG